MEGKPKGCAVVVGGLNIDIGGRAFAPLVAADSNPGVVSTTLGGVGRNIAHNLALLGVQTHLLTACGDDQNGIWAVEACKKLHIHMDRVRIVPDAPTPTYLYLMSPEGEMALAVSDMALCDGITADYLEGHLPLLQKASVVVADANIPQPSLEFLAEKLDVPLFVDPVSTVKAEKLRPILRRVHTLKPNRLEAERLTGMKLITRNDIARAADKLMTAGVRRLFLSLGSEGVYAAEGKQRYWLPPIPGEMVNTTGCGDAFMAALVWAHMQGLDLKASAQAGLAAAAIAMASPLTIHPGMSAEAVTEILSQPNN